ncbi:MAG: ribonuclease III [Dehalococcoidia bacterium]|nr:ribonuclease III [Dehalococcoidia bacterium]
MTNWDDCQKALGISFNDELLLKKAFVHSSYLNENPNFILCSNERLEFLGDAILGFVVAESIYSEFPELPEGELTRIRSSLVCGETLAQVASLLKLGDWLLLGEGEDASGGRMRQSNLANAVEALIGAIYLDQGLVEAKEFIFRQLEPMLERIKTGEAIPNYKALLQELSQKIKKATPLYHLVAATGPDHNKQFTVEVLIEGEVLGRGTGKNKKAAETEAARLAWENYREKKDTTMPSLA